MLTLLLSLVYSYVAVVAVVVVISSGILLETIRTLVLRYIDVLQRVVQSSLALDIGIRFVPFSISINYYPSFVFMEVIDTVGSIYI